LLFKATISLSSGLVGIQMSELLNRRHIALVAVSLVAGASCNFGGGNTVQDRAAASSSQIPEDQEPTETYPESCLRAESMIPELKKLSQQLAKLQEQWEAELKKKSPSYRTMADRFSAAEAEYARHRRDYDLSAQQCVTLLELQPSLGSRNEPRSGEWRIEDGRLVCDGYIVRRTDKDYCTDEVPEDWVPRGYDGQQYFFHRLGDRGGL
jgi:hypothetical protein